MAPDDSGYRVPPSEILDIIDAPPMPSVTLSPSRDKSLQRAQRWQKALQMMFLHRPPPLPPVAELARAELKLAGEFPQGDGWRFPSQLYNPGKHFTDDTHRPCA
eukprot:1185082-Prorocentrum_minimum.AAC.2